MKKSTNYKGLEHPAHLTIKNQYKNTTVKFRHPRLGEITYDTSLLGEDQETYRVFFKNGWEFLFTQAKEMQDSKINQQDSKINPPLASTKNPENGQGSPTKTD
jgi:hypothetical protein